MSNSTEKPGTFCWNELMTPDGEGAKSFYTAMFGWAFSSMDMPNGATYHFAKRPGDEQPAGGMMQISEEQGDIPPHWMSYIMVEDCGASASKAESLGATVLHPKTDIGMGCFAIIKDPQGAVFSLWEPGEAPAD